MSPSAIKCSDSPVFLFGRVGKSEKQICSYKYSISRKWSFFWLILDTPFEGAILVISNFDYNLLGLLVSKTK